MGVRRAAVPLVVVACGMATLSFGTAHAAPSASVIAYVTRDVSASPTEACDSQDLIYAPQIFALAPNGDATRITSYQDEPSYEQACAAGYSNIALSPDGSQIAAAERTSSSDADPTQLALIDPATGDVQRPEGIAASAVAWSPDSRHLAVLSVTTGPDGTDRSLTIVSASGSPESDGLPLDDTPLGMVWLANSSAVALLVQPGDSDAVELDKFTVDGNELAPVPLPNDQIYEISNNLFGGRFVGLGTDGFVTDSLAEPGSPSIVAATRASPSITSLKEADQLIRPTNVTWLPDGTGFAMLSQGSVYVVPTSGGPVSRPFGDTDAHDRSVTFARAPVESPPPTSPSPSTSASSSSPPSPPPPPPPHSRQPSHPRSPVLVALQEPGDISWSLLAVVESLVLVLIGLLIVFPAELFNSTFEEHYDDIVGWLRRKFDLDHVRRRAPPALVVLAFVALVLAVLNAQLDPKHRADSATAALVIGLGVGTLVVTVVGGLPAAVYHRRSGMTTRFRGYPLAIVVAAACVAISRATNFEPGYLYGVAGGLAVIGDQTRRHDGRAAVLETMTAVALAIGAWCAWIPIDHRIAHRTHPSFGLLVTDAVLGVLFLDVVGGIAIGLLPLNFLTGRRILRWSKTAWVAMFGAAMFLFIHTLLRPAEGYAGSFVTMVVLFAGFGAVSLAFWGYCRLHFDRPSSGGS